MTETIGSYEAKTHLPQMLRRVQAGHEFEISVRGVTVARLIPTQSPQQKRAQASDKMRDFLRSRLNEGAGQGVDLSALINEGRP
jgi:prevent-host-death family protein